MNPQVFERYRIKSGMSCAELCRKMGKTDGWYSRIKTGKRPLKTEYIPKMASIFGIKPERLAKEYLSCPKLEDTSSLEPSA